MSDNKPMVRKKPSKRRQREFIFNWLNPESETFGNAYESAIAAGFSEKTARTITGEARGLQWVQEAKALYAKALDPEHIYIGIQDIALNTRADRDKLTAYSMLAKFNGMEINRTESTVKVTFTNSVPRPIIDLNPGKEEKNP